MQRKKTLKPKVKKEKGPEVDVLDLEGKVISKTILPKEIFAAQVNEKLMAQAVLVFLANKRQGTASTRTRGEVSGSTRKIYRQKGTGRARHGDIKAPIFVGGGTTFGPKPKDYSLKLPKKARRKALFSALTEKLKKETILVVSGFTKIKAKTKEMVKAMKNLKIDKEKILLVLPQKLENVILAGRNMENLKISEANLLNTYEVLKTQKILFMEEALPVLKKTFLGKEKNKKEENGNI